MGSNYSIYTKVITASCISAKRTFSISDEVPEKNMLIKKKILVEKFSGKTSPFACGHTSNSVTINSLIFKEFLRPITDITFQKAGLDTN